MTLACFRRPQRPDDQLPASLRAALAVAGGDLRFDLARRVAATDDTTYWVLPTRDEGGVFFFGADDQGGGGGGGTTTVDALRERGLSAMVGVHRGRWRYAVLVADDYQHARAGSAEAPVADNFAVLDLPDRERFIQVIGPAGARTLDLGPSEWDDFEAAGPGLPDPAPQR